MQMQQRRPISESTDAEKATILYNFLFQRYQKSTFQDDVLGWIIIIGFTLSIVVSIIIVLGVVLGFFNIANQQTATFTWVGSVLAAISPASLAGAALVLSKVFSRRVKDSHKNVIEVADRLQEITKEQDSRNVIKTVLTP